MATLFHVTLWCCCCRGRGRRRQGDVRKEDIVVRRATETDYWISEPTAEAKEPKYGIVTPSPYYGVSRRLSNVSYASVQKNHSRPVRPAPPVPSVGRDYGVPSTISIPGQGTEMSDYGSSVDGKEYAPTTSTFMTHSTTAETDLGSPDKSTCKDHLFQHVVRGLILSHRRHGEDKDINRCICCAPELAPDQPYYSDSIVQPIYNQAPSYNYQQQPPVAAAPTGY
ncbi:unnamed protein product, partial [Mesorhabditis spiculigera]